MCPLKFELFNHNTHQWATVGEVKAGDPDGSVSDNKGDTRDTYSFGVDAENNQGYVMKSIDAVDVAFAGVRAIGAESFETVAELGPDESHEMIIKTDRSEVARKIRLTYLSEEQ